MFGNRWIAFGVTLAFFYGMIMLIEKNRHSDTGAALRHRVSPSAWACSSARCCNTA